MTHCVLDKTKFLNVDLDIFAKSDLQPLVDAMGGQVDVLFAGRVKRHYEAHLEANGSHLPASSHLSSPESLMLRFCNVIRELPPDARKLWDAAKTRTFDIGIDAPGPRSYYWSGLSMKVLKAASDLNAQIAVTIYGPMKRSKAKSKPRNRNSSK